MNATHKHLLQLCGVQSVLQMYIRKYCKSKQPSWRILFFGTDSFSLESLKVLNENRRENGLVDTLRVVCSSKYVKLRNKLKEVSPVWSYVRDNHLQLEPWPIDVQNLKEFDVGVLSSFGHLIPADVLHKLPFGIINVHPSLLPRWRGANPIMHTILNGDRETGVTIMHLNERFDSGAILKQQHIPVPHNCTAADLRHLLARKGALLVIDTLTDLEKCINNKRQQNDNEATYAPKRKVGLEVVDWNNTSESISRLYRAIYDQVPLQTTWRGNVVKLNKMVSVESHRIGIDNARIGQIYYSKEHKALCGHCTDGWLGFQEIVFNGKRLSASDFNNGFLAGPRINTLELFESKKDHR
ncbi:methionyl-tRNA formyltransferase, mitochondrial-like [Anneissia japonica]|uniref:methionyl-tRNA formyltransferase, mitochondrial-like n=1 Tax=Anneissia japonica TaxID=1529436 RepID=UPI001425A1E8|nr:methionyl-tRNA formyltransferase, mitochondrial-like [Anneissia japonica]XP_033108123.1 methionyl-tRNA formyltransferase, mitochondrial-like [Anneissia japonica]